MGSAKSQGAIQGIQEMMHQVWQQQMPEQLSRECSALLWELDPRRCLSTGHRCTGEPSCTSRCSLCRAAESLASEGNKYPTEGKVLLSTKQNLIKKKNPCFGLINTATDDAQGFKSVLLNTAKRNLGKNIFRHLNPV